MDGRSKVKRNILLIALIFSLSVNLAVLFTIVYNSWYGRGTQFQQGPFPLKDFSERLSARQLEEIRNLRRLSLAKAEKLKEGLGKQRELLIAELSRQEPDREVIDEILRDVARMQFELEKEVIDNLLRLNELLPPKERERVLEIMRERIREPGRWRAPRRRENPERFDRR